MPKLTLSFKGLVLKDIPLAEGETLIGNEPDCAVFIDSLALQPHHAAITLKGDQAVLRDCDTQDGTFVNGIRLTSEHPLKEADVIQVGKHTLTYSTEAVAAPAEAEAEAEAPEMAAEQENIIQQPEPAPTAEEPPAKHQHAFLQILNGQNLGKTISLGRSLTNLGKPGLQMAVISHRDDGYYLSHLEGEHSPKVGDVPIGEKARLLKDGDVIQIGKIKMLFYLQ